MALTFREDFEQRAAARLLPLDATFTEFDRTDFDLNPGFRFPAEPPYKRAAVLVGLVPREDDFGVLLTLRPETMARHAGQVAFPGGRIDDADASPLAAALREAHEEVGVDPAGARMIGQNEPYLTSTGYIVSPFVAVLPADFTPTPDPREVADVFETPLSFLMNPANHQRHERMFMGALRAYYAMPHNDRYIWGATAGMIKALYDRIYAEPPGLKQLG
jgi:8-oxo-dGTP pyrophosphatase MutT (NUDIX family)